MVVGLGGMEIKYKGLIHETLPSGKERWRVRIEGKKNQRITLRLTPDHKAFSEHYHAARAGIDLGVPENTEPQENSIAWLTKKHTEYLESQVECGQFSPLTLKKRNGLYQRLRNQFGRRDINMPQKAVRDIQRSMQSTPASADSMVEAIRRLYDWAIEEEICSENPATGVRKIDKGKGGAVPWSVQDLQQYVKHHPPGTRAHTTLMLLLFTACRIGDAVTLGYRNEREIDGITYLGWQPKKKGSAYVEIPMVPQLFDATRSSKVAGMQYLLKQNGEPYKTGDNLGQQLKKWTEQAGLKHRTAHGVRKSVGTLLAGLGCSQYTIMSVHGHTEAKTSEVYTKGVERRELAREAMQQMAQIKL